MTHLQMRGPLFNLTRNEKDENEPPKGFINPSSLWLMSYGRFFDVARARVRTPQTSLAIINENLGAEMARPSRQNLAEEEQECIVGVVPDAINSFWEWGNVEAINKLEAGINQQSATGTSIIASSLPLRRESINNTGLEFRFRPAGSVPRISADPAKVVVTAIIDDAVNIAHSQFLTKADKPRIDFTWLQDAFLNKEAVPFGREITGSEIEREVANPTNDEEDVLRKLGFIDYKHEDFNPLAARVNHGTPIAVLAAGADPKDESADASHNRIITVGIPRSITLDTSGYWLHQAFLSGLQYVLLRTRDIQRGLGGGTKVPVVINFSYGVTGGPHDGNHVIERLAHSLIKDHKARGGGEVSLVVPAGNTNLTRSYCQSMQGTKNHLTVPWRIQPADQTASFLEIWLPNSVLSGRGASNQTKAVSVRVTGPDNQPLELTDGVTTLTFAKVDTAYLLIDKTSPNDVAGMIYLDQPVKNGKYRILVCFAPTQLPDDPFLKGKGIIEKPLPAGLWRLKVEVEGDLGKDDYIEAWIQRDEPPLGARVQARQSYFDDPKYERRSREGDVKVKDDEVPASIVRRSGTINGISTGKSMGKRDPIFVVGGFLERGEYLDGHPSRDANKRKRAAAYSSTANGRMCAPSIGAASDRSRVLPGIPVAGTKSGSTVALNGTSVSAPQIAREIAQLQAINSPPLGPLAIRNRLLKMVEPSDRFNDTEHNPQLGSGPIKRQRKSRGRRGDRR